MATSVEILAAHQAWAPPESKPFDEAAWQAWVAKGRAQELLSKAACMKAVKWILIPALFAAAGLWFYFTQ